MSIELELLGRCPNCDAAIPTENVVITYRASSGWPITVAACSDCDALVHPA